MANMSTNMEDQIVFKLATVETKLEALLEMIKDRFTSMEAKFDTHERYTQDEIKMLTDKVTALEKWKTEIITKISTISIVIGIAWTVLSDAVKSAIGL